MIFSRISVFGECYDIFPFPTLPEDTDRFEDKRDPTVTCAYLLPSERCEAKVALSGKVGEDYQSYSSLAYAAAVFLTAVRGLPLDELDIETPLGDCKIITSPNRRRELLVKKCKLLYAKTPTTALNTDVKVSCVETDFGRVRVCECSDVRSFAEETLRALSLSAECENIRACIAVGRRGGEYELRSYSPTQPDVPSLTAAAALLCGVGSSGQTFRFIGRHSTPIFIRRVAEGYLVSCDYPAPLVLYTQDSP